MSTHSPCDNVTGCDVPFLPAPSADLLGSPVHPAGRYRTLGREESPSGSGRRHAWNSRPTGRYRNLGSLLHMSSSVEDGCGLRNTQCNTVLFVYGVVPSRPSGCLTEKIGFPGRARSKRVCVVFCVVWLICAERELSLFFAIRCRDGLQCNLKINLLSPKLINLERRCAVANVAASRQRPQSGPHAV